MSIEANNDYRERAIMFRWFIALSFFLVATSSVAAAQKSHPHIIVLVADDLGIGDLGCYNRDSRIPTPNMDRLAKEGMRFTDSHSPSAVCTPTRYSLLTGRYCWRTRLKSGVLWGYDPLLIEPGRLTLASLLRRHGYHTACIGKWHLGFGNDKKVDYEKPLTPGPNAVGFDYFYGIPASLDMEPYVFIENERPVEMPTATIAASQYRRLGGEGFWRAGPIAPGFRHVDVLPTITKKAVECIDQRAESNEPFFLYLPLTAPHSPWVPTDEFRGKSKAGYYGDFVVQVDDVVGQILRALDRNNLTENTLVIVTSDNGSHWLPSDIDKFQHASNSYFRGQKADIWEGGHRVPFIARWPGHIPPGSISTEVICHTDMLATLADLVGHKLSQDAGEDSFSILPVLLGKQLEAPLREATVHHSANGFFAIRQGDWVLIDGLGSGGFSKPATTKPIPGGPKGQLYNLANDIRQEQNVYMDNPSILSRMHALLTQYKTQGFSRPKTLRATGAAGEN